MGKRQTLKTKNQKLKTKTKPPRKKKGGFLVGGKMGSYQELDRLANKIKEVKGVSADYPGTYFEVQDGEFHIELGEKVIPPPDVPALPSIIPASCPEEAALLKRCGYEAVLDCRAPKGKRVLPLSGTIFASAEPALPTPDHQDNKKDNKKHGKKGNGNREKRGKNHNLTGFTGYWRGEYYYKGLTQKAKSKR